MLSKLMKINLSQKEILCLLRVKEEKMAISLKQ
jgi:hypothetical protein